jgi:hypothetical protein
LASVISNVSTRSFDPSFADSLPRSVWKQTAPPAKIVFSASAEAFPPLSPDTVSPSVDNTTTPTAQSSVTQSEHLNKTIAASLRQQELEFQAKLATLESTMEARLAALESKMTDMTNQIITATYKSLTSSGALVTQMEFTSLRLDVEEFNKKVTDKLDSLSDLIRQSSFVTASTSTPPRSNIRQRETSPESNKRADTKTTPTKMVLRSTTPKFSFSDPVVRSIAMTGRGD